MAYEYHDRDIESDISYTPLDRQPQVDIYFKAHILELILTKDDIVHLANMVGLIVDDPDPNPKPQSKGVLP